MGRIDKMGSNKWKHSLSLVLRLDALSVHAEPNGAKQEIFYFAIEAKTSRASAIVLSITSSVCAIETKPASKVDGAK